MVSCIKNKIFHGNPHFFGLVLVHCAAERRPDVAEQDQDAVLRVSE
jgi:hypothetical protein